MRRGFTSPDGNGKAKGDYSGFQVTEIFHENWLPGKFIRKGATKTNPSFEIDAGHLNIYAYLRYGCRKNKLSERKN